MALYSPKIDVVFRKLFGSEKNKDLLISLINSVISPRLVAEDLEIRNPYNLATYIGSKESILDIKAVAKDGVHFNVEMQLSGTTFYGKRGIYYSSKVLVDQLEEGMPFSQLNTTIGIHLVDFDYFRDERYVRHFAFKDMETNEFHEQLGCLQLYFVEMKKFRKLNSELAQPLDRWIAFLNQAEKLSRDALPETLRQDPTIVKAINELEKMGLDPVEREIYEAEVKATMVDEGQLEYAEEKGREKGKEEFLTLLLEHRFSTLPADLTTALDKLTSAQMDDLGKALFDFRSLADLEAWLSQR